MSLAKSRKRGVGRFSMRRTLASSVAAFFGFLSTSALAQSPAAPSEQCDTETIQKMAPADTTIGFAAREGDGCRVSGLVTTQNPGPNRVLFNLFLPNNSNGRYLYLGVGGAAGKLPFFPINLISQGYALAGSDGGSGAKSGADYSFYADPGRAEDYSGGRGVRVSAAATQQITRKYFGRQNFRRYIIGCSGGGSMGLTNARRSGGQQFDGFLVGAVSWPDSAYMSHVYAIAKHLQNVPEGWISPELLRRTQEAIIAVYDGADGVTDGVIADQRSLGQFDKSILTELGYTPAQVATFDFISQPRTYSGKGLHGKVVFPGFPITNVGSWSTFLLGRTPPPWRAIGAPAPAGSTPQSPAYAHIMADTNVRPLHGIDYWTVKDDAELVSLATNEGKKVPYDDPMDFSALASSGSKMIFYHGVDDPNISYLDTLAGYETILKRFPGASSWLSAVAVPGFGHCRGGLGPTAPDEQLLGALVNWVEKGEAPKAVVSDRESPTRTPERSFLLCAEPLRAQLKEPGLDPGTATNWTCI